MDETVLENHYLRVADESPLPILLYNVPMATTISLSNDLISKLAQHENVVGLKDSSGHVGNLTDLMRRVPDDFSVFTGNAPTLLPALLLGVVGGILAVANVAPQSYKEIVNKFQSGDIEKARALQLSHNPLALAVTSQYGVPGLKAVLRLQGHDAGYPRAPLQDVSKDVQAELQTLLTEANLES